VNTYETLWNAIPYPAFVIDPLDHITDCNNAAEIFAETSRRQLQARSFHTYLGAGSAILDVVEQARKGAVSVILHNVEVAWADKPPRLNNLQASVLANGDVLLLLHPRGVVEQMDRSLTHRSAARSVSGMAAMLAHEIRNPLAGIRGAAQLLAMNANTDDLELTELIEDETNRIGDLVTRVEEFGDLRPAPRTPVNIHDVLERARRAAKAGFAAHAKFSEQYDPSLPPVAGNADQLIQIFLNLFKNAAEAIPKTGGTIAITTAFRQGVRLQLPGQNSEALPLEISITDNGAGVPKNLIGDIFDPFVSSKAAGTGLGLSLVSKIIAGHGGVIECDSRPGRTCFRVLLPIWRANSGKGEA